MNQVSNPTIDFCKALFNGRLIFESPIRKIQFNVPTCDKPLLSDWCWITLDINAISEIAFGDNNLKSQLALVTIQQYSDTMNQLRQTGLFINESEIIIQKTIMALCRRLGITNELQQYARYRLTAEYQNAIHDTTTANN